MTVKKNALNEFILSIYDADKSTDYEARYLSLIEKFITKFEGKENLKLFSVPGRTELGGNHTDHGNGRVLAAAVNLDIISAAELNGENEIVLYSDGYGEVYSVKLNSIGKRDEEAGTSSALIRGVADYLLEKGFEIGGFNAYVQSDVLNGAGLSSSAAFEILIGMIFNVLFNENKIPAITLAKAGQFAENNYFGKPCGLMDQIACASGGIVAIDFENNENPAVEKIDFNFTKHGYKLLIVNTGGNHAKLTEEYAAIPDEMNRVAEILGKRTIREISRAELLEKLAEVRKKAGDRAVLRALHFINENERVARQTEALKNLEFNDFLKLVAESGDSSFMLLQNIVSVSNSKDQGVALALALSNEFLKERGITGASRVHGGGFAGTIQVYLPKERIAEYKSFLEPVFGKGCVIEAEIRTAGAISVDLVD